MAEAATTLSPSPNRTLAAAIPRRQMASAAVGNLIEWFDWNAYAFLSVYFAKQFFPANTLPIVALLGTFGIMAIGFLVRPVAGLIIGRIADRMGRRFALMLTVYGMGAASLMIGILPTYAQIGVAAPLLLLLARVVQGICIGGEYAAMSAFAMEMAPQGKRGLVAGILNAVACIGQLFVTLSVVIATWLLSASEMSEWGWRVIFIFGALLSVAGIWIRRGMVETAETEHAKHEPLRIFDAMRRNPRSTVKVVGLTIGFTAMVYAWGTYLPTYAMTYKGLDPKFGMVAMMISVSVAGIGAIGAGLLSDRFGRRKTMLAAGIILTVGTVPAMSLLSDSLLTLIILQCAANLVLALLQASSMPAYTEMFPKKFRAAGLGFPYSMTVGLIGGTAPLVGTQFAAMGFMQAFPWYLAGLMAISVVFYASMKETAFKPLPE